MRPMYISLLIDVEDPITLEADDAARDVANVIADAGARATMCVVGENARLFRERGRTDVIEAIKRHDIGLHTNTHSFHPTTCELLENLDWEEGVEALVRTEAPGVQAIREVFGVQPSCWGGAGNTWGPQVAAAIQRLDIPAYVYAHTAPPGDDLHMFNGVIAYGGGLYLGDQSLHKDEEWRANLDNLKHELLRRNQEGAQWTEVFTCHPVMLRCEQFWDGVNFANGATIPKDEWQPARLRTDSEYRSALRNLGTSIHELNSLPGIQIKTISDMNDLARNAAEIPLDEHEIEVTKELIRYKLEAMKSWPIHKNDLNVSRLIDLTIERIHTLRKLRLPPSRG
jgi:hypothetical protein